MTGGGPSKGHVERPGMGALGRSYGHANAGAAVPCAPRLSSGFLTSHTSLVTSGCNAPVRPSMPVADVASSTTVFAVGRARQRRPKRNSPELLGSDGKHKSCCVVSGGGQGGSAPCRWIFWEGYTIRDTGGGFVNGCFFQGRNEKVVSFGDLERILLRRYGR